MDYQNLVRDFALRTQHNLKIIRRFNEQGNEVYETSQLINSMLGFLVLPTERYYENIPRISLDELQRQGWPTPVLGGEFNQPKNLRQLIAWLRNSIAHFNIEFTSSNEEIDGVKLSNKRGNRVHWQVQLSLDDLEQIVDRLVNIITESGSRI